MIKSRLRRALPMILIVVLALAVRIWFWSGQGRASMIYQGDQDEYYRGAIHILLQGDYYDEGQWLRPPLTSIWLAGNLALFGFNLPAALLMQCVLSAATVLLLAELARNLFDSPRSGIVAALLTAVFVPYADYASQLLSETLFIFTIAAALLIFEAARRRGMPWRWLLAGGLMWGLATLTRPVGLYATPLMMGWAALEKYRRGDRRFWSLMRAPLALLIGFVIVVAPWTARNYAVYHRVILVDTNGGISFWLGNLLEPNERNLQFVWNRTLPDSAQRQQAALERAWSNIRRAPLLFVSRLRFKTVSLWQLNLRQFAGEAPIGLTAGERSLWLALASDTEYVALMLLALLGVVVALPTERNMAVLIWPIYGTLLSAISLGHPRLRLPLLITAIVYAALPLAHPRRVAERLRVASWWRRGALISGILTFVFLIYASAYGPFIRSQAWLLAARLGGGAPAYDRAIAADPDNYLPYLALAQVREAAGDIAGALAMYDQAAARAPQNVATHLRQLNLRRQIGDQIGAQAAMKAVADVAWDNNQAYDWSWSRIPAWADAHADIAAPAPGVMRGVSAVEFDQSTSPARPYRWILYQAQIRIRQPSAHRLTLVLRANQRDTPVSVAYQRQQVAALRVGTNWQQFEIALPAGIPPASDADHDILEIDAPTDVRSVDRPYPEGVALAEVWLD